MNTETHIELHGKCLSTTYRGNILYQPNKPITINHPLKKGSKNLPAWFEISEESLKELKSAEKKSVESKASKASKAVKGAKDLKEVKSENSLV